MQMRDYLLILAIFFAFILSGFIDSNINKSLTEADSIKTKNKSNMTYAKENGMTDKVTKSNEEWKKLLSPEQYYVLREKGTERPFTGKFWNTDEPGTYSCAACGLFLFGSDTKFESSCGWPSFYEDRKS